MREQGLNQADDGQEAELEKLRAEVEKLKKHKKKLNEKLADYGAEVDDDELDQD